MSQVICPKCNEINSSNALHCAACGASLRGSPHIEGGAATPERSSQVSAVSTSSVLAMPGQVVPVSIVNFNMPFWALVGFMIKVALASIPAVIILAVLMVVIWSVLGGMLIALLSYLR